ncbi:hypothetical protein PF005_g19225 [Phytophthora fragariae]|uniref:Uncharacterized protein n=1 Tax=Phytophthora fragariae TaxID=53985 RepID=A0A6A3X0B8_9STRA|nr:hypothetical protein PF003_g21219 [Phytophthora fragariae]KAE8929765.1 hypothetical protein PF009_g20128 [Phytophthora fragariae]KAE9090337.1 hypothetical protein PF007_g19278 [Phytophthora fragariae]KAE9120230.1 hypothetical protein PF006_g18179 [Phytophthora fragariae]KAE9190517.1 hypothetical protein PF005_g19225 [Phytophthora fragariae]
MEDLVPRWQPVLLAPLCFTHSSMPPPLTATRNLSSSVSTSPAWSVRSARCSTPGPRTTSFVTTASLSSRRMCACGKDRARSS